MDDVAGPPCFLFPRPQATLPTPTTKPALVGKAAAIVASTLALALHSLWARPFSPEQTWKNGVRAALLVLAAASAAVVAWASALDLRLFKGAAATESLTAGSYALVVLFCIVIAVLVGGLALAMLQGVRAENARALAAQQAGEPSIGSVPAAGSNEAAEVEEPALTQSAQPSALAPQSALVGLDAESHDNTAAMDAAAAAASSNPMSVFAFAVHPVRRPYDGGKVASGRRRQRQ